MSSNCDPLLQSLTIRLNSIVGIKKYQEIKKVMADFDLQFKEDLEKPAKENINIKVP